MYSGSYKDGQTTEHICMKKKKLIRRSLLSVLVCLLGGRRGLGAQTLNINGCSNMQGIASEKFLGTKSIRKK